MNENHEKFTVAVEGFDLASIEKTADTVFAVSPEMILTYFNPAWYEFARKNHGEPGISQRFGLGSHLGNAIPPILREFYDGAYRNALETGTVWEHEYECSSADTF